VLDSIEFDRRGIPAVAVCTDYFISPARTVSKMMGIPDYPVVFVPHPLSGLDSEEVAKRAEEILPVVLRILSEGKAGASEVAPEPQEIGSAPRSRRPPSGPGR
jgi:hypothetical protein